MTDPVQFDPQRIMRVLAAHDVEYLLVGGLAATWYGATRLTADIDTVPNFERANLQRLAAAMRELNARLRYDDPNMDPEVIESTKHLLHADYFATMQATTTWNTDAGPLDILRSIPDATGIPIAYERLRARSEESNQDGLTVAVAALSDVVASKMWANRPKDHEALPELRRLLRGGQELPPPMMNEESSVERGIDRDGGLEL